jgi:hypothetical protein
MAPAAVAGDGGAAAVDAAAAPAEVRYLGCGTMRM